MVKKSSSKSKEYWADRFTTIEASVNKISESIYKNQVSAIKETQRELSLGIEKWVNRLAVNNELNIVDARELLNKSELAEFRWTLEEYIKYGEENAINQKWIKELENASARVHIQRLEALKLQSQKQLEM
ncbi:MAG: phage head morphogenesis protein, partial [Lachnospirales bacterium]